MKMTSRIDPMALWRGCAIAEEMFITDEDLFGPLRDTEALANQMENIASATARLRPSILAGYGSWLHDPKSYRFASEAFYQSRILFWLDIADRQGLVTERTPIFLARQILRPSAFSGSPRIKHVDDIAFVLYPQAAIYWLYEVMALVSLELAGQPSRDDTLREFIYRALAKGAFEMAAHPAESYALDFLLDEIVLQGSPMAEAHDVSEGAARLASGVEDFIVCHELAHAFHDHCSAGGDTAEDEANATGLRLMSQGHQDTASGAENSGAGRKEAFEAFIALQIWAAVRSSAERRALPLFEPSPERVEVGRARATAMMRDRIARVDALGDIADEAAPASGFALFEAGNRVVKRIMETSLNDSEVTRIVRLSRALAAQDYLSLRDEVRKRCND